MKGGNVAAPEGLIPVSPADGDSRVILQNAKPGTSNEGYGGEEKRRSQRVLLRMRAQIHVALKGKPTTHEVVTLSVNAHGALIAMKQHLPADTRLILENAMTKERIACKVVRPPRETPEGFHTAVEFDSAAPDFWKIAFPPANWRAEDC